MFSDLQGRNAVVFGVANKRSIAWSIAQGLHAAGMKVAIAYQNERLEQEARDLILSLPGAEGFMCDVSKDEDIDRQGRLRQHHARRISRGDGCQRLLADRGRPCRRAAHGRWRLDPHHDLLRFPEGRAPLQRHGRSQGRPGVFGALSCL